MKNPNSIQTKQRGFATIEIVLAAVVLLAVGFGAWHVFSKQRASQQANSQKPTADVVSGPITAEDRKLVEEAQQKEAAQTQASQPSTTPAPKTTAPSTPKTAPTAPSNTLSGPTTPATSSTPPDAVPSNTYTRPTTAFCQQKDGNSFTNAWVTDNSSHTYQVWENGAWANKTETGTAGLNSDSMKVVGVIPYHQQAAWAICNQKSGYITFYYKPVGSVYTYNWLVAFEDITITQP